MHIDARKLDEQELFAKLKDLLSSKRDCDGISIEILVGTLAEVHKIKAFASMSGLQAEVANNGDHFMIHLKGNPCCS